MKISRITKAERGITLVALIITIIILVILAAVAITTVYNTGIIGFATEGVANYAESGVEENRIMNGTMAYVESAVQNIYDIMGEAGGNGGGTTDPVDPDPIDPPTEEEDPEPALPEITEEEIKGNTSTDVRTVAGVIEIVWLNESNNVIDEPLSPAGHLGGLTAVKYEGGNWVNANTSNEENDWYNYVAKTGTGDNNDSHWANAKAVSGSNEAYFVWIPRYAYKIIYFDNETHANAYRADNSKTEGIKGYSVRQGIVAVDGENLKLVEGTAPTNVTEYVQTAGYTDYIPHPAFEFGGSKAGIWVGKYESSGSSNNLTIIPNTSSWRSIQVSDIYTECQKVKTTYSLPNTSDTHMMKNIEWGAVAYLTESKYGRNGTEVTINDNSDYKTGDGDYLSNKNQSTTGNEYGIYDMSGGAYEYVAGYVNNTNIRLNGDRYTYNKNLVDETESKYKDVYNQGTTDDIENNYNANKGMKGDAVYETSTSYSGSTSWHGDYSYFPYTTSPVFRRGR